MNFKKDLLLVDLETTGLDPEKQEIIQLAAVLLDKRTLKEKKHFNSYIHPTRWNRRDPESMAVNKISYDRLKSAPSLKHVINKFLREFGSDVILSYYVGVTDVVFLQAAFKKLKIPFPYDYHTFNIWGLFFPFLGLKNRLRNRKAFSGFGLDDLLIAYKIESPPLHDALVDCRAEAEVLRQVLKELK